MRYLLLLFILLLGACAKKSDRLVTSAVYDGVAMLQRSQAYAGRGIPLLQASYYAEIRRSALTAYMERYQAQLFKLGIPVSIVNRKSGWNERFNCVLFSELYVAQAGAEVYLDLFSVESAAQRPAMFIVWYMPDGAKTVGHSIVCVLTDEGVVFIDPQSQLRPDGVVTLTPSEIASIYYRRA